MNEPKAPKLAYKKLDASAEFFAAVRFLQVMSNKRLGDDTHVGDEPMRLVAKAAIDYPATEVANVQATEDGLLKTEVSFLGLHGPTGALPQHYTQTVIDRVRAKDFTLRNFLDLFNHRWLSLFYRGWEKNFLPAAFETSQATGDEDAVTQLLWSLVGFGTDNLRGRLRFRESLLLHYSGHTSASRPTVSSIVAILADTFQIEVVVKQFQGQWIHLDKSDQTKMGHAPLGSVLNNRLGMDTVAGSRIWSVENRFQIVLGPLRYSAFMDFSPVGSLLPQLLDFVRTYVGPNYDFDVRVILDRRDVPGVKLGDSSKPGLLGWNTWLGNWLRPQHADDAIYSEKN